MRLKNANNEILNLNESILVSNEKAKRNEDENKELTVQVDMLKKDVMEWENKERIMNEQLKGKVENVYEQSKKAQNLEGELFIVQEKLRQV